MYEPILTIFLSCYNRPDYARLAIRSVVSQTACQFRFRISDNSTNDLVQQMVATEFSTVDYVRRTPSTIGCKHGNIIIDECNTDYVMIMHDDDELSPTFVEEILKSIINFPVAGGFAANAKVINEDGAIIKERFFLSGRREILISDPLWLARRWWSYASFSVAPFPSYVYKTSIVNQQRFNTIKNGQYGDFIFVHQYLMRSRSLVWLNLPLYKYRRHSSQDSAAITFASYFKLKRYIRTFQSDYYKSTDFRIVRALHLISMLGMRGRGIRKRDLKMKTRILILFSPGAVVRKIAMLTLEGADRLHSLAHTPSF